MTTTTNGPWRSNHGASLTQINAGAYSTITSVGNTLNQSMLTIGTSAVIHEGNLLDLTVTHMGGAASNVGLMIKSTDLGRSEYVSPSWRSNIISVGEGAGGAAAVTDWFVSHPLGGYNIADDAMPGPVAVNPDPTSQAMGYMTWDNSNLYIMLTGVTFLVTDGMWYLDTQQGGSNVGDNWYVSHNLPFEADYMLWAEDRANWGIRKVMPGGNWVDVTSACTGMQAAPGFGYPGVTPTWSGISEFAIPWDCIGSPTGRIKTLAIIQNENSGHVLGVYPPQLWNQTSGAAQTFGDFGTLQLAGGDLADGTLDDYLLIHRTFTQTGATTPRAYDVTVKVRDADNIYWDWGTHSSLAMDQNQDITIDILRAKPVIADLVDVSYDEDSGSHTVTLTDKAADYQQPSSTLSWTVTNDATNPSNATSPYAYDLTGQTMTITPDANEFGNQRLYLVVKDGHGLYSSQSMLVGVENVNDAPVINNPRHSAGLPVFTEGIDANGNAVYNYYDEPQRPHPVTGEERGWDLLTKFLGGASGEGFVQDLGIGDGLANEQDRNADNNTEQAPQTYTWTAVTDPEDCTPFTVSISGGTTLEIDLNEANEDGGTCNIVLDLSDGASINDAATTISVPFTVQPTNDNTRIIPWDVNNGSVIQTLAQDGTADTIRSTANAPNNEGDSWWWSVDEDTEDSDLLTIDLTDMMSDNDNTNEQLYWTIDNSQYYTDKCQYTNYFSATIDNEAHTMEIDLIPDATTDATSSEWDMLQDADGDGIPDDGIHQKAPRSGDYCLMNLILWDSPEDVIPAQYDYVQSDACNVLATDGDATTNCYSQTSSEHQILINVHNLVELRPDYNFNEVRLSPDPFDFKGIDGVLRETMVPVSVNLQHTDGDAPINTDGTYKYLYDLQVSFYIVDTDCAGCDGTYQSSVRLGSNGPGNGALALPDYGGTVEVGNYVRMNKTSEDVRVFVDIMTVNPFTGQYTDNSKYERPALEEKNWADNNMTASATNSELPLIVETKAAQAVASFAPTLMAVGLVGVFVGALLSRSRAEDDEEEFEEESMIDDDRAVSPVIATILLVAITVVLAGVIYVWAGSLADTSTKGTPRLTFSAEAITVQEISGLQQDQWHWRVTTSYAATDLATQAVTVSVLWTNASGQQVYKTALAPGGGDEEHVYGFAPRNSENMVTFWDDISHCERGGAPCITTFGPGDRIFIRMTDNDGLIDSALIDIQYELPGGAAYMLKQYTASPTSIR
jgi:flagellin-like protein